MAPNENKPACPDFFESKQPTESWRLVALSSHVLNAATGLLLFVWQLGNPILQGACITSVAGSLIALFVVLTQLRDHAAAAAQTHRRIILGLFLIYMKAWFAALSLAALASLALGDGDGAQRAETILVRLFVYPVQTWIIMKSMIEACRLYRERPSAL